MSKVLTVVFRSNEDHRSFDNLSAKIIESMGTGKRYEGVSVSAVSRSDEIGRVEKIEDLMYQEGIELEDALSQVSDILAE